MTHTSYDSHILSLPPILSHPHPSRASYESHSPVTNTPVSNTPNYHHNHPHHPHRQMGAFCRCAELVYALEMADSSGGGANGGGLSQLGGQGAAGGVGRALIGGGTERPVDSAKAVLLQTLLPTLRQTTDNLICVIHNMHLASTVEERAGWTHGLDKCLALATDARFFHPQSLVGKVGQWLRNHVDYTQT